MQPQTNHIPSLDFRVWPANAQVMRTPHTHPDVEVNCVLQGSLNYLLHGRFVEIRAGQILIFWAGVPHQMLTKSEDIGGIWMTIPLQSLLKSDHTREMAARLLRGELIRVPASPLEARLFERWSEDFNQADPRFQEIARAETESYFARISLSLKDAGLRQPRRRLSAEDSRMERVLAYLAAHYHEEIRVDEVAKEAQLHPKYLLSVFRRACRMTLWEYVIRLRLAHAQKLLLTTDRTVADIAFDAGFNSLSAFYHAFRKYVGAKSPAEFRMKYDATG